MLQRELDLPERIKIMDKSEIKKIGKRIKKEWEKLPMRVKIGLIILALCMVGCVEWSWVKNYQDDNFLEEVAEELIENELGLDVDLTPFSPEKK